MSKYGTVYLEEDIKEDIEDIIGNTQQKERLEDFFNALENFTAFSERIIKTRLVPNLTMLLYGPPGTGKTSLTRAFAKKYKIPMCVVESDRLVSSLLGDTIKNIRNVMEVASDIANKNRKFLLFFDEIDAIGSERSNVHEVGEIKRAVISFLQTIDELNYKGYPLAIFGATNHQHQLDSAIWRRFTFHLRFDFPNYEIRKNIIESFLNRIKNADIKISSRIYEEIRNENIKFQSISNQLKLVLKKDETALLDNLIIEELKTDDNIEGLLYLTHGYSGSDIERGIRVALFKAIGSYHDVSLTFDMLYESLKLVGGTAIHVERQDVLSSSIPIDSISGASSNQIIISNYEEMLKELPYLIPLINDISKILKNKKDLQTEYFTGNKELGEFINNLIEISKLLKINKILKLD